MALLETEALVLRTYNLAESDKIVVCLTRSAGLVRAVARGCRKLKSRFGASLEPFTLLNISCYLKENQELISLQQAEILKSNFNLSGQPETLVGLAYMGDLVIEFSPPYQPHEKLFRMVKACLEAIAQSPEDLQAVLRYFEIWLLKLEGFLPDLARCAECHKSFNEGETVFMSQDLGLHCQTCNHGSRHPLSQSLHTQLRASQKVNPLVFAQQSHKVPTKARHEMADLTHRMIGRALERQPRIRPTFE